MIRKDAPSSPFAGKRGREEIFIRRRIEAVAGLMALGIVILVIRAVDLHWLQADRLKKIAEKQRYRQYEVAAPRGAIMDAKGRILAESVPADSVAVIADEIPADKIPLLAKALDIPAEKIEQRIKHHKGFVWLARQVSPDQSAAVAALGIAGVRLESEWRRYHPLGPATGHLIGFVGVDGHGLEGVERALDERLSGRPGIRQIRRDARGHSLPGGVWLRKPTPGGDVRLTIDATIQSIAYAALVDSVREQQAKGGSVVILRPGDGAILAMANWPSFNPNDFRRFRPSQWRNRAITDVFEPGSALKPFTVAAALMSGRWRVDSRIYCEKGVLQIADHIIHDAHPEGWIDLTTLLAKSSNIGAAKVALDIGPQALYRILERAGFGHKVGIGLPGESPGIMLPAGRWGPIETANIAFGQGIAVTTLQLAAAFSIFANDGVYVHPKLIHSDGVEEAADLERERVMPTDIARQIVHMLEYAVSSEGTGANAVPPGYRVAGKTGTAQKPNRDGGYDRDRFTAVFAGIAPVDDPRLVIAIAVDEPRKNIYGGQVAAPIFREIVANTLPYLGVPPEHEGSSTWRVMTIVDDAEPLTAGGAIGLSLREVRRLAARLGLALQAHGSGWVVRQSPARLDALKPGDVLEVWLDD